MEGHTWESPEFGEVRLSEQKAQRERYLELGGLYIYTYIHTYVYIYHTYICMCKHIYTTQICLHTYNLPLYMYQNIDGKCVLQNFKDFFAPEVLSFNYIFPGMFLDVFRKIYLEGRGTEKEGDREGERASPSAGSLPRCQRARAGPAEARNSIPVSHVNSRGPGTRPALASCQVPKQGV